MDHKPLISCVVITYNTGAVITETLDSIYNQSYENIELIVTDDGSRDGTIEIVEKWLSEHKSRFNGTRVLTVSENTGTCKNLNRGVLASHGEWIKSIGDDVLIPTAIEEYVKFVISHENCQMCVSKLSLFGSCSHEIISSYTKQWNHFFKKASEPLARQKRYINKELVFTGPTYFYSRDLFNKVGGFDDNYVLLEEWPFCKKVLEMNFRIYAIDKELVKYRVSESSVCHTRDKYQLPNPILANDILRIFYSSNLKGLIANKDYLFAFDRFLWHKGLSLRLRYNNRMIYYFAKLLELLSPYKYVYKLRKFLKHES